MSYLQAVEKRGWVVGVVSAKNYIDLVMEARPKFGRWEEGRAALRWLMDFMKRAGVPVGDSWRGRMEQRLREKQYADRTVETYQGMGRA